MWVEGLENFLPYIRTHLRRLVKIWKKCRISALNLLYFVLRGLTHYYLTVFCIIATITSINIVK
jgi:hypothetical protein